MKKRIFISAFISALMIFTGYTVYAESPIIESGRTVIVEDTVSDTPGASGEPVEIVSAPESLTILFMGDIMGHDSQINSALQPDGVTYDYNSCFDYIRDYISKADLAIANLEVTLAGPPYKGYPRFSSPDALAAASRDAGIDVLVTANNHSVDRGRQGLERTIKTLDDLNIPHTGTFLSKADKEKNSPLIIEKNNFKIALINYTYGTNGIPVPEPSVVNLIRIDRIKADIAAARAQKPDAVILFLHWGNEYQREPDSRQTALAEECFKAGADIIIGSHPHVIQKSILERKTGGMRFISYSLGNFIANQKAPGTKGGKMIRLTLSKDQGVTTISKGEYILTWIYGTVVNRKKKFYILPCKDFENRPEFFSAHELFKQMKAYIEESRKLLNSQNKNVDEERGL
jgi:poly-gamma-glutamate synthesis protein (capsule biosynthesis protein)